MSMTGSVDGRVPPATRLTAAQVAALRRRAAADAGSFVDPRRMRRVEGWWTSDLREWATAILGEPMTGLRVLSWQNWVLLDLARDAEPSPPPPRLTAERAAQRAVDAQRARDERAEREAKAAEWATLRAALPVPVSVAFNFSRHTYEFHVNGGHHIVTWGDLHIGRLRRSAGRALCETPARSRSLHLDNARLERIAQDEGREQTFPTCKACLDTARRVAGPKLRAPEDNRRSAPGRRR
jgi:hypothetical protein